MDAAPRLTQGRYDRAAHHRSDVEWLAAAFDRARVLLVSPEATTPAQAIDERLVLSYTDAAAVPVDAPRRFLGLSDGVPYFSVTVPGANDWRNLREIADAADDLNAALLTSAIALQQWHGRHPHCSLCGAVTNEAEAGWTRVCSVDGSQHFPRTDPAVIMLVHKDGRALLGHSTRFPRATMYSTLAGFVEPGETLEEAVRREVQEEVGVLCGEVHYHSSQPWPFPGNIMLGFYAEGLTEDITIDPVELKDARWFTRDEMLNSEQHGFQLPRADSIARRLIEDWLAHGAG
jgi:NAD+ diphosphatase